MEWTGLLTGLLGGLCAGSHQPTFGYFVLVASLIGIVFCLFGVLCFVFGVFSGCLASRADGRLLRHVVGPAVALGAHAASPAAGWAVARALQYRLD